MIKEIKPPNELTVEETYDDRFTSIFLAGSIEMGTAENWQEKTVNFFKKTNKNIIIYNPRRDSWDSSWVQSIKNKNFREQVEWELHYINFAKYVVFYFDPNTKSPITLLELGTRIHKTNNFVCCPDGFWRKGNIEVLSSKYKIPLFKNLNSALNEIKQNVGDYEKRRIRKCTRNN